MKALFFSGLALSLTMASCQEDGTPQPPTASFTYSGTLQHYTPISFTSTFPAETYAWDFGDAGTSTLSSPDHTFRKAGTYTVTLRTTSPNGPASTSQKLVLAQADTLKIIADRIAGLYEFRKVIRRTLYADKSQAFTRLPDTTMTIQRMGSGLVVSKRAFLLRGIYPWEGVNTFTTPSYYYYENGSLDPAMLKVQQQGDSVYIGLTNYGSGTPTGLVSATYFYYGKRKR